MLQDVNIQQPSCRIISCVPLPDVLEIIPAGVTACNSLEVFFCKRLAFSETRKPWFVNLDVVVFSIAGNMRIFVSDASKINYIYLPYHARFRPDIPDLDSSLSFMGSTKDNIMSDEPFRESNDTRLRKHLEEFTLWL